MMAKMNVVDVVFVIVIISCEFVGNITSLPVGPHEIAQRMW